MIYRSLSLHHIIYSRNLLIYFYVNFKITSHINRCNKTTIFDGNVVETGQKEQLYFRTAENSCQKYVFGRMYGKLSLF